MPGHRPRKRFAQHFLTDRSVIDRIFRLVPAADNDVIVEIGPGRGALTRPLLETGRRIEVIEIDRDLAAMLEQTLPGTNLAIHVCDVLDHDFSSYSGMRVCVVGNLPYNISTPVLFHLLQQRIVFTELLFMLQEEVVDRICATPGNRQYGRLSVMVQACCSVEALFTVKPGSFEPPPAVNSRVIRLVPDPLRAASIMNNKFLSNIVRQAFSQRRKKIKNALSESASEQQLEDAGINPGCRAEEITVAHYINLANMLQAGNGGAHD